MSANKNIINPPTELNPFSEVSSFQKLKNTHNFHI